MGSCYIVKWIFTLLYGLSPVMAYIPSSSMWSWQHSQVCPSHSPEVSGMSSDRMEIASSTKARLTILAMQECVLASRTTALYCNFHWLNFGGFWIITICHSEIDLRDIQKWFCVKNIFHHTMQPCVCNAIFRELLFEVINSKQLLVMLAIWYLSSAADHK